MKQNQMAFTEKRIILSAETTEEELSQYSSGFKVPILQDGDLLIWDSLSILEYLSETYYNLRVGLKTPKPVQWHGP